MHKHCIIYVSLQTVRQFIGTYLLHAEWDCSIYSKMGLPIGHFDQLSLVSVANCVEIYFV